MQEFLLKFDVSGVDGGTVSQAKLRLFNINASNRGGNFYAVTDDAWSEDSVVWNNAPAATDLMGSLGGVVLNTWQALDLSGLITGDGTYSLRVNSTSDDGAGFASREIVEFGPELLVSTGPGSGLLHQWKLDENGGTVAADTAGGANGTLLNGTAWVVDADGPAGSALDFDGIDDRVSIPGVDPPSSGTLEFWMYVDAIPSSVERVLGGNDAFEVRLLTSGRLTADMFQGGSPVLTSATALIPGVWHHVAMTWQANTSTEIYLDGVLDASGAFAATDPGSFTLSLGTRTGNAAYFDGRLDEVALYSYPLSAAEVHDHFANPPQVRDSTPPLRSDGTPSGILPMGTAQAELRLTTDEAAACRYGSTAGTAFAAMTEAFSGDGVTHAATVTGLLDGRAYTYYVRCQDAEGNANAEDYTIRFFVRATADDTPPLRSNGSPSGALPPGTSEATLALTTDEAAACRYATTPGIAYGAMTGTFAATGGNAHSTPVAGLQDGSAYTYYVRCEDAQSNVNPDDFAIGFSVDAPADTTPPLRSNGSPSGTLPAGTTQTTLALTTDENASCRYATAPGVDYADMTNTFSTTGGTAHSSSIGGLEDGMAYTYSVRCEDSSGNANAEDYAIAFAVAQPSSTETLTFAARADATVKSASPVANFGGSATLEVDHSPVVQFLLKFDVTGIGARTVTGAKVRLYNVNKSNRGGRFYRVEDDTWDEAGVTWSSAPPAATLIGSLGAVKANTWYEIDVAALVTGDGVYSLRVDSTSNDGADYASKEGAFPPELVLTVE